MAYLHGPPQISLDIARDHLKYSHVNDTISLIDDWNATLDGLINITFKSAIMLHQFVDVRVMDICKYWVSESVETAYSVLAHLDRQLREEVQRRKTETKTTKAQRKSH